MADGTGTKGGAARAKGKVGSGQSLTDIASQYSNASTSYSSTDDPAVYLGSGYAPLTGTESYGQLTALAEAGKTDQTANLSVVSQQYYQWDQKTRNKFLTQLSLAGWNVSSMNDDQLAQAWAGYAQQSSNYYAANTKLTPWDIMAKDRLTRESAVPTTTTATNLSYDMSTKEDAHAIFLQASQSLLGRGPTKGEIGSFQKQLNTYERQNPVKTVSTTTTGGGGDSTSTTETSGGVTAGARGLMAEEEAKQGPEYGAYQASTTYFNALLSMLGG